MHEHQTRFDEFDRRKSTLFRQMGAAGLYDEICQLAIQVNMCGMEDFFIGSKKIMFKLLNILPQEYQSIKEHCRANLLEGADALDAIADFEERNNTLSRIREHPRDSDPRRPRALATQADSRPVGECFAFMRGDCKRGDSCRFKHSETSAPSATKQYCSYHKQQSQHR